MPYDEADETDPMMLVGVELPADASTWRETARVLAEEFSRMGFDEDRLLDFFRDPFYAGAHQAFLVLGEDEIRKIVRTATAPWKAVSFRERDVDPDTGMSLLPVLEPPGRSPS